MTVGVLEEALEREHVEIDDGIEGFLNPDAEVADRIHQLTSAFAALRRHIYLEEEFLFPPMRAAGLFGPIMVMLREHGDLWKLMDVLEREAGQDPDTPEVFDLCRNLIRILEAHNE